MSGASLPPRLVLGLNKADQYSGGDEAAATERIAAYLELLAWFPGGVHETQGGAGRRLHGGVQRAAGEGANVLMALLRELLPRGPRYYPAEQVTDIQTRFIVAELIREKALMLLQQEVPHSLAVVVDEFTPRSEQDDVYQRDSVCGAQQPEGDRAGAARRDDQEDRASRRGRRSRSLVGTRVYLELWVKVYEKWRRKENLLRRSGVCDGIGCMARLKWVNDDG